MQKILPPSASNPGARSNRRPRALAATAGLLAAIVPAVLPAAAPLPALPADHAERMTKGEATFESAVRSALKEHCLKCHGGEKVRGDFDLASRETLLKGGADGPSVVPFHPEKSRLLKMLRHEEEPFMPEKKPRLPDALIDRIAEWIEQGAPFTQPLVQGKKIERDRSSVTEDDRRWWSFQPLAAVALPDRNEVHPIDRLLASKAAEKGLSLAPRADRRTLIRRATLDLTGLPPTPEEVQRFESDPAPDAWPKLIDSLLARPGYGERWARHWMDVARYGESSGFEQDYDRTGSYHYRDFLIQALNSDMPFNRFVQWQIAGDEFAPGNAQALAATAFLSLGVFPTQITINELERVRYEDMDDMLSTTGAAFLGLTIGCARCHDHKYDPIPTRDYYRMLSTFTGTVRSEIELDVYPEQTREQKAGWKDAHERILAELGAVETSLKPGLEKFIQTGLQARFEPEDWTVWAPESVTSTGDTTFVPQADGSFLTRPGTGPKSPPRENFVFSAPAPEHVLTGIRVEALVDASLPNSGAGRGPKGGFQLSAIRVQLKEMDGALRSLSLASAEADFEQDKDKFSVASALHGKPGTGWAVGGREKSPHAAAFTLESPLAPQPGAQLIVTLEFQTADKQSIGRPRLALSSDAAPRWNTQLLEARLGSLLRSGAAPQTASEHSLFERWWRARDPKWRAVEARRVESEKNQPTGLSKVLVASESYPPVRYHTAGGNVETYKETFVLKRGNVALKEEPAAPGFLQVLSRAPEASWSWTPPEGATYAGRRRALASWILDEKQGAGALAARVFVNRLWLHHFGQGIVRTANDFGKTGTPPSQPELLDWLAGELLRSGGSVKAMHRLIMSSEAYQQAALKESSKETADPGNELFMRRLPRRLEGEAIRDSMLAVSGRLDPTLYGPPVREEGGGRRSVYLRVKRSQLLNTMVSFDQPEPLASQGFRPTTTVAPQALILMNNQHVRACAQAFAERVGKHCGKNAPARDLLQRAYAAAIGRPPSPDEIEAGSAFLESQSAGATGPAGVPTEALADFCQVLFETNEFAYLP
jgi:mono/diheme cytochrome c family protein